MLEAVNAFQPDVLFGKVTAKRKMELSTGTVDAKIICSIGAVFDFMPARSILNPFFGLIWDWFIRCQRTETHVEEIHYWPPFLLKIMLMQKMKHF
jgi:hypothetical protein